MALNLTPEYFEAERKYRQARTPAEKLAALEEMLRVIPKHKSSEKKQADLKRRISELRNAPKTRRKGTQVDPYHIDRQGAGQVVLFGLPNSGKSSLVGAVSKAPVKITEFPFGTQVPVPGMAYYEDVPIQLVDCPPVTPDHVPPGLVNAIRNTDIVLMVADASEPSVLEDIDTLLAILRDRDITFDAQGTDTEEIDVGPKGLLVCTKADVPGSRENLDVLRELRTGPPPMLAVSAVTREGLDAMLRQLFELLGVIRVYTKLPGKPPDLEKPFVLPSGTTVGELARHVHKEIAERLKYARVWGEHVYAGQQVHASHVLADRDVVELHS